MEGSRRGGRRSRVREAPAAGYGASPAAGASRPSLSGVLLDSDVVIEVLRGRPGTVRALIALEESGAMTYCTPVTVAEIHAGLRPGEEALVETFFASRGEVLIDAAIGRRAGSYLARYARSHGVTVADALVAAAAAVSGLRLWTLNRRHYPMPDLALHPERGRG